MYKLSVIYHNASQRFISHLTKKKQKKRPVKNTQCSWQLQRRPSTATSQPNGGIAEKCHGLKTGTSSQTDNLAGARPALNLRLNLLRLRPHHVIT